MQRDIFFAEHSHNLAFQLRVGPYPSQLGLLTRSVAGVGTAYGRHSCSTKRGFPTSAGTSCLVDIVLQATWRPGVHLFALLLCNHVIGTSPGYVVPVRQLAPGQGLGTTCLREPIIPRIPPRQDRYTVTRRVAHQSGAIVPPDAAPASRPAPGAQHRRSNQTSSALALRRNGLAQAPALIHSKAHRCSHMGNHRSGFPAIRPTPITRQSKSHAR